MKQSRIDKKIDRKEAQELKKIYNHYFDKRKEIKRNTKFRVADFFGDFLSKDSISPEQITKLDNFFTENIVNTNSKISFNNFLKLERKQY